MLHVPLDSIIESVIAVGGVPNNDNSSLGQLSCCSEQRDLVPRFHVIKTQYIMSRMAGMPPPQVSHIKHKTIYFFQK